MAIDVPCPVASVQGHGSGQSTIRGQDLCQAAPTESQLPAHRPTARGARRKAKRSVARTCLCHSTLERSLASERSLEHTDEAMEPPMKAPSSGNIATGLQHACTRAKDIEGNTGYSLSPATLHRMVAPCATSLQSPPRVGKGFLGLPLAYVPKLRETPSAVYSHTALITSTIDASDHSRSITKLHVSGTRKSQGTPHNTRMESPVPADRRPHVSLTCRSVAA